ARELNSLIFEPLRADVRGVHALYFVPDGALHYVPFAVLAQPASASDGNNSSEIKYLIEDHDIAIVPAVLFTPPLTHSSEASATEPSVLVVPDPVYTRTDSRLARNNSPPPTPTPDNAPVKLTLRGSDGGGNQDLERLPGSGREASVITALFPPGSVDTL